MPVSDEKYIKAKARELNGVTKNNFLGNEIPNENVHHVCVTCITMNSVVKAEKKYRQVY